MSNRKLQAELFLNNVTIRITDENRREFGNILYSYYYKNGSVNEFEVAGLTLRIKQRNIPSEKLFGDRVKGRPPLTKLWLFCDGKKIMTLRVFPFYRNIHQSIHIDTSYEYFDDIMFYLKMCLD